MVELLVVIVIIIVLFSSIFVASHHLMDRARGTSTRSLLQVVNDAIEQFGREQKSNPTITKAVRNAGTPPMPYAYTDRYGAYPPDELEVFTVVGVPGWTPASGKPGWSLAPSKATVIPEADANTKWKPMQWIEAPRLKEEDRKYEHRDLAAMVLAIETLGVESKVLLDRVPARNRTAGAVTDDGTKPLVYLDRPSGSAESKPNEFDAGDLTIRYIVDEWGMPLSYFATRDWVQPKSASTTDPKDSSNHPAWRHASTQFVRMNKGLPLIMSYGPNGKEQLSKDWMERKADGAAGGMAEASMVGDYEDNNEDHKINHPLNEDNVYLDPDLKDRLAAGPVSEAPHGSP